MIGIPSDNRIKNRDTDVSFFEALACIVRASGLTPAEIARRANKQINEMIAAIPDTAERLLTEAATSKLYRQTVSRAVRGDTSVSKQTFSRIALGLNLDPETYYWLEGLREAEPHVHHSTQQRAIVTKTDKDADKQTDELPRWIMEL
jgi:hypothetical protein